MGWHWMKLRERLFWLEQHSGTFRVICMYIIIFAFRTHKICWMVFNSPFFIHPVFRDEGHFMIVSQFQAPNYFLLAFLEDYRMDPARAQPLLTISIFDNLAEEKDLTLVRCDIINQGIEEDEGYKICKNLLDGYVEEEDFRNVHMFNKKPDAFDVDAFVKEKEVIWKEDGNGGESGSDGVVEATAESKKDNAV